MSINTIDILFALLFIGVIAYGFFSGIIRLVMLLIALYLSVIVAGLFYIPFGDALRSGLSSLEIFTSQVLAFLVLACAGTAILTLTMIKTFVAVRLPNFMAGADQVGGASLGLVVGLFAAVITTIILRIYFGLILSAANAGFNVTPILLTLALHMQTSFLANFFIDLSKPIFTIISPWFPNGLPPIMRLP